MREEIIGFFLTVDVQSSLYVFKKRSVVNGKISVQLFILEQIGRIATMIMS